MMNMKRLTTLVFALVAVSDAAQSPSLFTVPLMKQDVPVLVNGRVVAHKSAYFGKVEVGTPEPQNFTVVFDTGSGHFFLPSSVCKDESCLSHQRYDSTASASAVDINHDGGVVSDDDMRDQVAIAYGTGEIVGEFVKETVCVGDILGSRGNARGDPTNCARMRVIAARKMSAEPFKNFEFDGVLGLGLEGLALDPEFHFLGQLTRGSDLLPIFAVYLAAWEGRRLHERDVKEPSHQEPVGEITFGGVDERRVGGPMAWVPVVEPSAGHWRIKIKAIRVGDTAISFCDDGDCTAILDTGTSLLGVPKKSQQELLWQTARAVSQADQAAADARGDASVDCREVAGPPLIFDLGDGLEVRLEAEDYSRPAPSSVPVKGVPQSICRSSLLPIDMQSLGTKVFIWGEPVLRRYYTAYDAREPSPRIGFASLKAPSPAQPFTAITPSFLGVALQV